MILRAVDQESEKTDYGQLNPAGVRSNCLGRQGKDLPQALTEINGPSYSYP